MVIRKSKKQPLKLAYDNIIVGSSLEAVLFAYNTSTPLIYTRSERPYYFETVEDFGLGTDKLQIWDNTVFLLTLSNLVPFADKIKFIRYLDSNNLKIVTMGDAIINITFNRLFLFDDHNFFDLPEEVGITTKDVMVLDWMKVLSGKYHNYDIIQRDSAFMNKIIFYPSGKRHAVKQKKDCFVVSLIKENNLYDGKHEDYIVRIKTENIFSEYGIAPNINGKITLEHKRRDVIKLGKSIYADFDNVIYMNIDAKSAHGFISDRPKVNYLKYLKYKLGLNGNE